MKKLFKSSTINIFQNIYLFYLTILTFFFSQMQVYFS